VRNSSTSQKDTRTPTMTNDAKPGHTKLWHALVERAITTAQRRGTAFTVEAVLDSIGVFSWAPHRQQAFEYATEMLDPKAATTNKGEHDDRS
jgi:hypothetical protein